MAVLQSIMRCLVAGAALVAAGCATTAERQGAPSTSILESAGRKQSEDQIVVLIGLDGLRANAIDDFPGAAPNLRKLAAKGVRAAGMVPAMPSVTFVNFYTIATGLYPEHHGIVSNASYSRAESEVMARTDHGNSKWWGGEPIWSTAEKQGVKTATMFWLGSEAEVAGARPSIWLPYEHAKPFDERTAEALGWLALPEAERPRLVTVYFHAVDTAVHINGVRSGQERDAIALVDAQVGAMVAGVEQLGLQDKVNFIVVSDHGMIGAPGENLIDLEQYISFDDVLIPEFEGPDGPAYAPLIHLFVDADKRAEIYGKLARASHDAPFKVYRREHLPERWRMTHPDRTGDIIVAAEPGWMLFGESLEARYLAAENGATHGYDRHLPGMLATFIADGPRFEDGVVAEPFDNVEVYGMIADILGVAPAPTDGSLERVQYFMTPKD